MSIATNQLILSRAALRIARGGSGAERRSTASYLIHQAVADLFGDREDRGYLYRVTGEWPGGAEVLILSHATPIATNELDSPVHRRAQNVQSKPFDPSFTPRQHLDFELRLNATQVVTDSATGKKRRTDIWEAVWQADRSTPLNPHQVYSEYLQRKLEGIAELLPGTDGARARITERGEIQARRGDQPRSIRFVATNLIGTLRLVDPVRFLDLITDGIGRSRAFGCGLLMISRPGTVLARRYPERAVELL